MLVQQQIENWVNFKVFSSTLCTFGSFQHITPQILLNNLNLF